MGMPPPATSRSVSHPPAGRLRIGPWEADVGSNELHLNGSRRRLEPKTMQVLFCLAEKPGEVVSREELLARVWPDVVVGDEVLTQAIIKLRKALGDHARSPNAIETISKRGYRLLLSVSPLETMPAAAPAMRLNASHRVAFIAAGLTGLILLAYAARFPEPIPAPPAAETLAPQHAEHPTLTVMPFGSEGEPAVPAHFVRGIAADLAADLAKVGELRVIAGPPVAGSAFVPPQPGARYLVTGHLQRSGKRLRIGLWLLDTRSGETLWSERFDRPFGDLPQLQEEIVHRLTAMLPVQVSETERARLARRHTRSFAAYDLFLRGQAAVVVRRAEENEQAKLHYRGAIDIDPQFARAYAGLALAYAADYRHQWAKDRAQAAARAVEMAETAWQIDPEIPSIYWVRAYVRSQQHRFDEAMADLERAIALDRSYADAYALMGVIHNWRGQPAKGIPLLRTALRLNPQASHLYFQAIGKAYLFVGDTEQAVINLKEALFRNPVDLESRVHLAAALVAAGDRDAALWEVEEVRALEPAFSTRQWLETNPMADRGQRQKISDLLAGIGLR